MSQNRSSAVMQQRAPAEVAGDTPEQRLFRNLDYYPTPPWAARAIAHRLKEMDPQARTAADPACGMGHFAEPLREVFGIANVWASDIYNYGYGRTADMLADDGACCPFAIDWYVTNPPFTLAQQFIEIFLRRARRGVIVLCRIAFLESVERYSMFYEGAHPLTCLWPFAERVPMQLGSWDPNLHSATAYAAFVFHKYGPVEVPRGFPPGTREKYWLLTDPARFAQPAPIPLFSRLQAPGLFQKEIA